MTGGELQEHHQFEFYIILDIIRFDSDRDAEHNPRTTQVSIHIISHATGGGNNPVNIEIERYNELLSIAIIRYRFDFP
jgi:hypothetical protein